jgi:hypothetical protein
MDKIRNMIDAIEEEDFASARKALTTTLAEYMAGKRYLANSDLFGEEYGNPNDEEQKIKYSVGG